MAAKGTSTQSEMPVGNYDGWQPPSDEGQGQGGSPRGAQEAAGTSRTLLCVRAGAAPETHRERLSLIHISEPTRLALI
eukprot:14914835-Alexandrium_andersonii.AAC.1